MTCQRTRCRWRWCPGCGRERRLARDRTVMCQHNRWDPAAGAMVPCEGSGQQPSPYDAPGGAVGYMPAEADMAGPAVPGARRPDPAARRGAA
jgi:hypothetical protein